MGIGIKTKLHWKYFEVIVIGDYDLDSAVARFPQILMACKISRIKNILVDFSQVTGSFGNSFSGLYALKVEVEYRKYLNSGGHELKIAYFSPSASEHISGEEIAVKGENPFKLFDNKKDALKWLGVDEK